MFSGKEDSLNFGGLDYPRFVIKVRLAWTEAKPH
jgi:hypothetical protein